MQIVLNTGQSPLASYEKTKAQRGEGACPRSSVYRLPRSLAPEATPSSPGCSWVGSDEETGARQPHDGQAAWPIGTGPEPTKESPEGGDDAENQSLGQAASAHVGQNFWVFFSQLVSCGHEFIRGAKVREGTSCRLGGRGRGCLQKQTFPPHSQRAGVQQPSLHSAEDGQFHKGQGSAQAGNMPASSQDRVRHQLYGAHRHHQASRSPHRWNQLLPSSACPCEESELQSRPGDGNKGCSRAGGGRRGLWIEFNLSPTFCTAYKPRTDLTFLNSWGKLKEYFVTREIQMSMSADKAVLAHSHAPWFMSRPQLLRHRNG